MNLNLLLICGLVLMPLSLVCYNRLLILFQMHLKICFQLMPLQCQMKIIVH